MTRRDVPARPTRQTLRSDESPLALPSGTRLNEFEVIGLIGEGGFGIVYQAYDTLLHRRVAIKEFMPVALAMRAGRPDVAVRSRKHQEVFDAAMLGFINEARLLAQFDHESLVKVYRFWNANGTAYMVMPYYDGVTLWDALRARKRPPDEAWLRRMLPPLMEALAVLHHAKCYHRDVSPDNILLLKDSQRPVLLDFGAARQIIGNMTHAPTVILKTGYAPVEQYGVDQSMAHGPWTDIYALAAVVYFAITGNTPPPSVGRLMQDTYAPLEKIAGTRYSRRFLRAIDHALRVRPKDRPQSIDQLATELGMRIATGIVQAQVEVQDPVEVPVRRRFDRRVMVAVLATVLAISAASAWWTMDHAAKKPGVSNAHSVAPPVKPPVQKEAKEQAPAPLPPYSPAAEMTRIVALSDPAWGVAAQSPLTNARIGKDALSFTITSSRNGFAYVFMTDPQGEYMMLFPNAHDTSNAIQAGETLSLPRASWPMVAGAPAGPNEFLVLVSPVKRDFTDAGLHQHAAFSDITAHAQHDAALRRTTSYSPFAGVPHCTNDADCPHNFGATTFRIDVVN